MSLSHLTRPSIDSIDSATTQIKFDREPYLRVLPAVSGVKHSVIFAGFDDVRFTDANGEIIKCHDGTDFYRAPRGYLITAALENAASKLDDNQWAKLCKNDPEALQTLLDAAKQTYYAESDIPKSSRSQKPFEVRGSRLVLMAEPDPTASGAGDTETYRPVMSFKPTVTFLSQNNPDNTRQTKEQLNRIWVQLDGTARSESPGSAGTTHCISEASLGGMARQLRRIIPGIFQDQLRSLNNHASEAQSADTAKQIENLVEAHVDFMTHWNGRGGLSGPRGGDMPPAWESESFDIPNLLNPVSLQFEVHFDGRPRTVEDRAAGIESGVATGGSSAAKGGDGAATSNHTRPFTPPAAPFYPLW